MTCPKAKFWWGICSSSWKDCYSFCCLWQAEWDACRELRVRRRVSAVCHGSGVDTFGLSSGRQHRNIWKREILLFVGYVCGSCENCVVKLSVECLPSTAVWRLMVLTEFIRSWLLLQALPTKNPCIRAGCQQTLSMKTTENFNNFLSAVEAVAQDVATELAERESKAVAFLVDSSVFDCTLYCGVQLALHIFYPYAPRFRYALYWEALSDSYEAKTVRYISCPQGREYWLTLISSDIDNMCVGFFSAN